MRANVRLLFIHIQFIGFRGYIGIYLARFLFS